MKGVELFVLERFIKEGELTVKDLAAETLSKKQNARIHINNLLEKKWIKKADNRVHPVYYTLTYLGKKIYNGVRNVQDKPVIVIK